MNNLQKKQKLISSVWCRVFTRYDIYPKKKKKKMRFVSIDWHNVDTSTHI